MIDPPVTPSFPAGHALEATLIALALKDAWASVLPGQQPRSDMLDYLAFRIGENRVIAGLHFPLDIAAGNAVAVACYPKMLLGAQFTALVAAARGES
jgi:acid phosphatase (class A)